MASQQRYCPFFSTRFLVTSLYLLADTVQAEKEPVMRLAASKNPILTNDLPDALAS